MYILKNALRCISRSKGRNCLIGIIALVIAVSACIGLSIRQAAESAKTETMAELSVTGTISFDRQSMMGGGRGERPSGGFDKDAFASQMSGASSLTLEEYRKYAAAESVKDFYYTLTTSFNGSEGFEAVTTETESDTTEDSETSDRPSQFPGMGGGMGGMMMGGNMFGAMSASGDFSIVGYSSETAMSDFASGVTTITDGVIFTEQTEEAQCVISQELATYNDLAVGDAITITNPNSEEETYTLTITGIYTSSATNEMNFSMFSTSQDPANKIYMSAAALQKLLDSSAAVSETITDEETGRTYESAVTGSLSATYVFANTEDYYQFEEDVRTMGLSDSYTVSSADISAYENSLTPLKTLSTMAGWFLLVILIIGAIILVVLNIFNVRERKYEIGVLTAMGMKKGKVVLQFIAEILVITMIAVMLGAVIGAISSVPVTNMLLANQIESQSNKQNQLESNFGRGEMPGGMPGNMPSGGGMPGGMPGGMSGFGDFDFNDIFGSTANYVDKVDSAMNLTVVVQMLGIGLLLTLVASSFSMLFVMRYDPLKILANRD